LREPSGADEERAGPELSEGEILGVLVASNATEIAHGHEVAMRLTDEALREYASDMIMAHTQAQVKLTALAAERAQPPEGGPLTQELASREGAVSRALQAEPASVHLDRQYALAEMLHHRELLELIDYALLPESRSSALRAEILRARNASEQRLQRIGRLAQRLGLQESAVLTQR
jgi:predicted outer membrane protein